MQKRTFVLLNSLDNSLIDVFESYSDFPSVPIATAIMRFWGEQKIKDVVIDNYKSEHSVMTEGKVILSKDTIDFKLTCLTDIQDNQL